ncbi:MAG: sigma-70 family RNA polymerase sigma factor [Planctomycetota bacterium]
MSPSFERARAIEPNPLDPTAAAEADLEAIRRILSGETEAYGEIVARHEAPLRRLVRGLLSDSELVEDVLQEVFFNAYRSLGRFRGEARLGTWLYRIAVREAGRARKRLAKLSRRQGSLGERDVPDRPREPAIENREQIDQALSLLDRLPTLERAAFVLYVIEDRSYADISEILDAPPGTVASWIHRARGKLEELARVKMDMSQPSRQSFPSGPIPARRDCS